MVNQCLEGYLHNYVIWKHKTWYMWLHLGEFCYNTTFHLSIGMTPFKDLYGYDAPTFLDMVFGDFITQKNILDPRYSIRPHKSQGQLVSDTKSIEGEC